METLACRGANCAEPVVVKKYSLCRRHYNRWNVYGDLNITQPREFCKKCGINPPEPPKRGGSFPEYCSKACRVAAAKESPATVERYRKVAHARKQRALARPLVSNECAVCAVGFESARKRLYCSKKCASWAGRHMGQNECKTDGCDRPMRAKGLCSSHYNKKFYPDRHKAMSAVLCAACGAIVARSTSLNKARRPACSSRCRSYLQSGRWPEDGKELIGPVARRAQSVDERLALLGVTGVVAGLGRKIISGTCPYCGTVFVDASRDASNKKFCSPHCTSRFHRRAGGSWITRAERLSIYERDGWVCQLCLDPVDADLHHSDDWAASLDHIVPRSKGGTHDHKNLRMVHRWCNAVLGDGSWVTEDFFAPADAGV